MSIIARFTIPAEQFELGDVLEVRQGVRIRLESMIPTGDSMIPYFWVPSGDAEAIEATLRQSSLIEYVQVVDETETETLFRVQWGKDINGLIAAIQESEAVLLEAEGLGDSWSFRMRFPEHQDLSEFYQTSISRDIALELDEVNNPFSSSRRDGSDITPAQREALQKALEAGYFEVPRRITLEKLAGQLGISDTALSQRLRRGADLGPLLDAAATLISGASRRGGRLTRLSPTKMSFELPGDRYVPLPDYL
jgi:predicted DNA binding protein